MRNNQPVTQREYVLDEETVLISRSDLKGNITYANAAFVEVSGYSRDELLGAPHNLIRHPDMPEAAYADFWKTIQAGGTWQGTVKNRRKNGDHYWVNATVAPLRDGDRIVGYTSLRRKASPKRIALAEQVYADIREKGKSRRYTLQQGALQRRGARWHCRPLSIHQSQSQIDRDGRGSRRVARAVGWTGSLRFERVW